MYRLNLKSGYNELPFKFSDEERLKDFMFEALECFDLKLSEEPIEAMIEVCADDKSNGAKTNKIRIPRKGMNVKCTTQMKLPI